MGTVVIEVSGIRIDLDRIEETGDELDAVRRAVVRALRCQPEQVTSLELRRRSVDARKRDRIRITYTALASLKGGRGAEERLLARLAKAKADKGIRLAVEETYRLPARRETPLEDRVVVVGAGCAGLFCALALAHAGLEPLLVERGDDATRRSAAVACHNETGELDCESNVQFGLGGAGTFSDGKLTTGTKSPSHRLILETFVDAGAPRSILWDAKPHVGSDILPGVVTRIVGRIRELGGEVWLRSRLVDVELDGRRVRSVTIERRDPASGLASEARVGASRLVLACGHSARDVFDLLKRRGVTLERKVFSMGVRIEHLQRDIDRALYGRHAGSPVLGAAPYKLVAETPTGRSAYSFCMCPGGYVVSAASEPGGVCTNGMSLSDRAGDNANAGLLVNVRPDDLPGSDVLAGVELQRTCERAAFAAGGGGFVAPAQLVGDFLDGRPSTGPGRVSPTYPRGVSWGDVGACLPEYVTETLREGISLLGRHLRGFDDREAVLTGVETRSSSPVRVTRDERGQSVNTPGLFPCGEGAGYAGGIMSAAADGLRCAEWVVASL